MRIKNAIWALALGVFITACDNDDNTIVSLPLGDYENGILITNEGPFNNGTGTVSFISDNLETQEAAIFNTVNNADLGNIVQSIGFADDKAYIIANVSNKITVVNRYTFEEIATIDTGLNNPRFFVEVNGKGYVTNWGDTADETDDFVALINLETNSVDGTIPVDFGPEELVANSSSIYVAHQGAFGQNNKVSVVDLATETVATTITVGDVPKAIMFDSA
ncbi:YncE family protein, partial [Maribacter sp.]|nr:YncE family protein [Maribacter sp.]